MNIMKQQVTILIKKMLDQVKLTNNQLKQKHWEENLKKSKVSEQEIISYCQEVMIDILNTAFRQNNLQVPQNLINHLDLWRNCLSVPELVEKTMKSTKNLAKLEELANDLFIKQKAIVFISNTINRVMDTNVDLSVYMDSLWMDFWQDEITVEKDSKKIIEHCQKALKGVFEAALSKIQLHDSFHTKQRIENIQNFSQLENLVEELFQEILKAKKKEYIERIYGKLSEGFKFSDFNEKEKQLISDATDLKYLMNNVIPEIKEEQIEEERIRNKVIDNLQTEFDRSGLNIEELDKNYIWTKVGDLLIPPEFSPWLIDKSKNRLIFARKVSSRLDGLKTVEEVKNFEQEVKQHLQEKAKTRETRQVETKILHNPPK
jgi:hypothetical protein